MMNMNRKFILFSEKGADMMQDSNENSFVKEIYKGKKKLLTKQKILSTVILGVIFGISSAIMFNIVQKSGDMLIGKGGREKVKISKVNDKQTAKSDENNSQAKNKEKENNKDNLKQIIVEKKLIFGINEYKNLYYDFKIAAKKLEKCTLNVIVENKNGGIVDSTKRHRNLGLIVAENKKSFYILSPSVKGAKKKSKVEIMGDYIPVTLLKHHESTGLMIVRLDKDDLNEQYYDNIEVANLIATSDADIGKPVLVYGFLNDGRFGFANSQITSYDQVNRFSDCSFSMMTTDIMLDDKASGVVADFEGHIMGFIDKNSKLNYRESFAVTELQNIIERLSNGEKIPVLGIKGEDVKGKNIADNLTSGVFVTDVENDSPAMSFGVLPGDILIKINGVSINDIKAMQEIIQKYDSNQTVKITLMRQKVDEYEEIEFSVDLK